MNGLLPSIAVVGGMAIMIFVLGLFSEENRP